jgi:hypothetical protein
MHSHRTPWTERAARALPVAFVSVALAWAAPAAAHHGWSGYKESAQQVTGTIKAVEYANPHVTVRIEAKGRTLRIVLAPVSRMESRGLPKDGLVVGQTVTVEAYPHESHADEMRAEWIEVGGKKTQLR